jgi:drug/metabolite transporter (DMT)-like permease
MNRFLGIPNPSPALAAAMYAALTIVIWVGFIIIARGSAHGSLTSLDIATLRVLGASSALVPAGVWINHLRRAQSADEPQKLESSFGGISPLGLKLTVQMGISGGFLYAVFSYSGFFYAPAAHASVLLPGSLPLWTSLLAWIIIGDTLSWQKIVGLILIFIGDLVVGGPSLLSIFSDPNVWVGDLLFMLASFSWSFYSVLVRRHNVQAVHATTAITVFALFSFVPLYVFLCMAGFLKSNLWVAPIDAILFQFFFQGVFSVAISGITFNKMIRYYGPVRSTMITAVVPVLSGLGASFFLSERMTWTVMMGLGLVTVGILFGIKKPEVSSEAANQAASLASNNCARP